MLRNAQDPESPVRYDPVDGGGVVVGHYAEIPDAVSESRPVVVFRPSFTVVQHGVLQGQIWLKLDGHCHLRHVLRLG